MYSKQDEKIGKQHLIQRVFDGELSILDLYKMEKEAVKEESYELAEVVKSAIDWINNTK